MSIQISVIIWTVICFALLMLILHNLLFAPVLKLMDARRKRIDDAREKKALLEKSAKEHEKQLALQKAEHDKQLKEQERALAEQINADGKRQIENAQKKRLEDVEKYRLQVQEDYAQIVSSVAPEIDKAAKIFAEKLISQRI